MRRPHAPIHRVHRRSAVALAVANALPLLLVPSLARALDVSTGPAGAQVNLAKSTFTLSGNNVVVGQIEPGEPRTTHNTINGRVTTRAQDPNDNHASGVAGILIGASFNPGGGNPVIEGVANAGTLFSTGYTNFRRPNNAADVFAGLNWLGTNNVRVTNWSGGFFNPAPAQTFIQNENGNGVEAMMLDALVQSNDWLHVQAAGNNGTAGNTINVPADAYNVVVVGATGATAGGAPSEDYTRVANYSSRGPTADGRRRVEIVAPGSRIFMPSAQNNTATQTDDGTSFAAPHVAGVAALLEQWAVREGLNRDRLSKKAMLLNGASKQVRDPNDGNRAWPVWRAATADTIPLNPAMGVGRLNAVASVRNYVDGGRSDLLHQGNTLGGVGSENVLNLLGGSTPLNMGALVTATLVWERNVTITDPANPQLAASYNRSDPTNLNLLLRNRTTGVAVAASRSAVDNVEHIYANVPADGMYDLVVRSESAANTAWTLAGSAGGTDGLTFSVRAGARGNTDATRNAVFSNDVHWLGTFGAANYRTESEIFVSGGDGKNMQRLSGALQTRSRVGPHNAPPAAMSLLDGAERGVLGLRAGETQATTDQLGDFSFGSDTSAVVLPNGEPSMQNLPSTLAFSVAGSPDVRRSAQFDTFGSYYDSSAEFMVPAPTNTSVIQHTGASLGLANTDDLDALELTSPIRGDFSRIADTDGDGMHNRPAYFTLADGSPSLGVGTRTADDIFLSLGQDPSATFGVDSPGGGFAMFTVFAEGAQLGLLPGDQLDGLALCDLDLDGMIDPDDSALFSVVAGGTSGLDGGSVFRTTFNNEHTLFASAAQLGIAGMDLDALDVMVAIPEPASAGLAAAAATALAARRARRRRAHR